MHPSVCEVRTGLGSRYSISLGPSSMADGGDAAGEPNDEGPGPTSAPTGVLPQVWMDIDINDTRAAYKRAQDFVAAKNLAYSLSSNRLEELGGSEKKRVKDVLYPADFEWGQKGRICVRMPPERLTFELWPDVAPLACQNFLSLATGHKGMGGAGRPLHYKGCPFHRIVPGFIIQGGDILMGNGSGGESIYGKPFKDDKGALKLKCDRRGLLAMGNRWAHAHRRARTRRAARDARRRARARTPRTRRRRPAPARHGARHPPAGRTRTRRSSSSR